MAALAAVDTGARNSKLAGLKETEIGPLPTDWRVHSANDLITSVSSGRSRSGSEFSPYPLYGSTGIIGQCDRGEYSGESILIARVGANAGSINVARGEYGVTDNTLIVKVGRSAVFEFVRLQLEQMNLNKLTFGSGQPLITGTQVKDLKLPLPPTIGEQQVIVDAIHEAAAYLSGLEELVSKKRQIMEGLMEELISGNRRLPGFKGERAHFRLGSDATLKARIGWQGLKTAEYLQTGDYLLVTGTEFHGDGVDWDSCFYVDQHRYAQDKHIQLKTGDVLVTKDGTIGKTAYIRSLPMPATLNSGVFLIRPIESRFESNFFYYVMRSSIFLRFLKRLSAGSTINHLYQKDFVNFTFLAPTDLVEQKEVAETLSSMEEEIAMLEIGLSKAFHLKQAMAQSLLTGRVRLA